MSLKAILDANYIRAGFTELWFWSIFVN